MPERKALMMKKSDEDVKPVGMNLVIIFSENMQLSLLKNFDMIKSTTRT